MSFETIQITRQVPIINSFVQLPNNNPDNKTSVPVDTFVAVTGGVVNRLPHTSNTGREGRRFGPQAWVEVSSAALEYGKTLFGTNLPTDQLMPWAS